MRHAATICHRVAGLLLLCSSAGAYAQATVLGPAANPPIRPGWRLLDGVWIRPAGEFTFGDLVRVDLQPPALTFSIGPSTDWRPRLVGNRRLAAELLPDRSLWHVMLSTAALAGPNPQRGESLVLLAADARAAERDQSLQVSALTLTSGGLLLRGAGRADGKPVQVEYLSARDGGRARLTVVFDDQMGYDVTGDNLIELLNRRGPVVRQFLSPLLTQIAGVNILRPRAGDVYRVFDHIHPTPDDYARLGALLPRLDDPSRQVRETASAQLDAMGAAAVLTVLRMDIATVTPEQASRLSDFLARNSLGEIDPAAAAADRFFLQEAAKDPDPRVRAAAAEHLEALAD